uniref:Ig-like domain-containing protein n=1 Tax=Fundulus heteroclitus TaxID=8078 RepID=A0A3Q2QL49_FUNHE
CSSLLFLPEVVCHFMESCILPCNLKNGDELVLHWFYTEGDLFNEPRLQDGRFRGRSSLFRDQISGGNASLLLTGVKVEDEGRYECFTNSSGAISHSFISVTVDAPVRKLKIEQVENTISCSSEGIYPNPEHSWSFKASAKTGVQSSITVSRTEERLYNINSSLTVSEAVSYLVYSCSFSTRRSKRKVTLFRPSKIVSQINAAQPLQVRITFKSNYHFVGRHSCLFVHAFHETIKQRKSKCKANFKLTLPHI